MALLILCCGSKYFIKVVPSGSVLSQVGKVLKVAYAGKIPAVSALGIQFNPYGTNDAYTEQVLQVSGSC